MLLDPCESSLMLGLLSGGHCGLPILLLARRLIVVVATAAAHLFMVTVNEKSIPLSREGDG